MVFDVDVVLLGTKEEYTIFSLPPPRPGIWIPLGAIGPVPVNAKIEFNLELLAEAKAQALLNFRTGMRQTAFAEFGIDYVRSREPSVQWIRDADFSSQLVPLTVDINGEFSLGLKLKPSVSFLVYGLAGMEAAIAPSGKAVFSVGTSSDLTGKLEADVSLEFTTAGIALDWLDPKPTLSRSIWSREWHLYPPLTGLTFVQHPQDTEVDEGDRLTLSALAQPSSSVIYDWYKDGNFYSHGQNQLSIARVNQGHTGDYHVVARSGGQTAVSDTATVTVTAPPGPVPSGMVLIPGGTNAGTDPDFGAYSLTVNSFHMDRYPVTKALWDEVYSWAIGNGYSFNNAGSGKAANHPVYTVNWYDVVKWCNARSEKEGRLAVYTVNGAVYKTGQHNNVVQTSAAGYRLPTDVEWEYAARGGLQSQRFLWGNEIQHARANYSSSSSYSYDTSPTRGYHPTYNTGGTPYTSPVGSFAANGYGLYDMSGNVWEWVFDWHPSWVGSNRALRGGSWDARARHCRVGARNGSWPGYAHYSGVGFRAVVPPGQ